MMREPWRKGGREGEIEEKKEEEEEEEDEEEEEVGWRSGGDEHEGERAKGRLPSTLQHVGARNLLVKAGNT
ncbi:hypothetical protein E2C01_086319 [Portunus trituberculatus]|uniref:Uncharacterized protein n=1 Tax=Portunus trituberculatus TaxID=210409 RepID=A0A5B7JG15_PORTR|nr:hypothetical protein [Portunus trituberculatus]